MTTQREPYPGSHEEFWREDVAAAQQKPHADRDRSEAPGTADGDRGVFGELVIADEAQRAAGELSDAIRVRIGSNLVERLDRIEALARGNGMRAVTRSTLIRTAVAEYVTAIEKELSLVVLKADR